MRISGIIGILMVGAGIFLPIYMGGLRGFINIPSIAILLIITSGLGILTYGQRYFGILKGLGILFANKKDDVTLSASPILIDTIIYLYVASIIGTFIGIIQIFRNVTDYSDLPYSLALLFILPFYSIVISECIIRPAVRRIKEITEPRV